MLRTQINVCDNTIIFCPHYLHVSVFSRLLVPRHPISFHLFIYVSNRCVPIPFRSIPSRLIPSHSSCEHPFISTRNTHLHQTRRWIQHQVFSIHPQHFHISTIHHSQSLLISLSVPLLILFQSYLVLSHPVLFYIISPFLSLETYPAHLTYTK